MTLHSNLSDNQLECIKHPGKKRLWICIDSLCSKETSSCCILCIKNDHTKCKDELIVDPSTFEKHAKILSSDFDYSKLTKGLSNVILDQISNLNTKLSEKQNIIMDSINLTSQKASLDLEKVCKMKSHLNIKHNKDTDLIEISTKIDINDENLQPSIDKFSKKLEDTFAKFLGDFSKLKFSAIGGKGSLSSSNWTGHANILLEEESSGLKVSRKQNGDSSFGYYTILDTEPIAENCLYKLTILSVYDPDRFLDWGIVSKTKYDQIVSEGYKNTWASGGISFCGYNYGGGLSGAYRTMTSSDGTGYKKDDYTYLEYTRGVEIKFYNEDLTNNLSTKNLLNEDYYMYFVVYHPQTSGILERLS